MANSESVAEIIESRWAWLRFRFLRWWQSSRALTPAELNQQSIIHGKDATIAWLNEQLAATVEDCAERLRKKNQECEKLQAKIDAIEGEVEVLSEMHERILVRIKAEVCAYAARIPPEEND